MGMNVAGALMEGTESRAAGVLGGQPSLECEGVPRAPAASAVTTKSSVHGAPGAQSQQTPPYLFPVARWFPAQLAFSREERVPTPITDHGFWAQLSLAPMGFEVSRRKFWILFYSESVQGTGWEHPQISPSELGLGAKKNNQKPKKKKKKKSHKYVQNMASSHFTLPVTQ